MVEPDGAWLFSAFTQWFVRCLKFVFSLTLKKKKHAAEGNERRYAFGPGEVTLWLTPSRFCRFTFSLNTLFLPIASCWGPPGSKQPAALEVGGRPRHMAGLSCRHGRMGARKLKTCRCFVSLPKCQSGPSTSRVSGMIAII